MSFLSLILAIILESATLQMKTPMSTHSLPTWRPDSWQARKALHQPEYSDTSRYGRILRQLTDLPPVVFPGEIERLRVKIAEAALGKQFILHGGDCVERFIDCNASSITNKLKILLQMSIILSHAARRPVIRIGRMAGQYFKPRSNDTEIINGRSILTYRGDTVNGFDSEDRDPDPGRLLQGYYHSTATLNYIRSMIDGGFADLHNPYAWNLYAIEQTAKWEEYRGIVDGILDAIHFMESFGGVKSESLGRIDFFTSHEGLHLGYESCLTRREGAKYYNLGAHYLWIGERTRHLDGAHVEYFRGLENPIGIKISSAARIETIVELCRVLNPENSAGRITLITRLGAQNVAACLPRFVEAIDRAECRVAWVCDPMHGNTRTTAAGKKTRRFQSVLDELQRTFEVHQAANSILAGVHFELTGEEVTECTGGAVDLGEDDLAYNYQSYCDPRLNYAQSMEMAFLISRVLKTAT